MILMQWIVYPQEFWTGSQNSGPITILSSICISGSIMGLIAGIFLIYGGIFQFAAYMESKSFLRDRILGVVINFGQIVR